MDHPDVFAHHPKNDFLSLHVILLFFVLLRIAHFFVVFVVLCIVDQRRPALVEVRVVKSITHRGRAKFGKNVPRVQLYRFG